MSSVSSAPDVCPCCFLNRISSLRNTPEASVELMNHKFDYWQMKNRLLVDQFIDWRSGGDKIFNKITRSPDEPFCDFSALETQLSLSAQNIDSGISANVSGELQQFMYPERLISETKMSDVVEDFGTEYYPEYQNIAYTAENNFRSDSSKPQTEILVNQIDLLLQEQKQFIKEMNLPISEGDCFRLELDRTEKFDSKFKTSKRDNRNTFIGSVIRERVITSGDQVQQQRSRKRLGRNHYNTVTFQKKPKEKRNKNYMNSNDEPVKLSSTFNCIVPSSDISFNKDFFEEKNISVKMIFPPENELRCSSSSLGSHGGSNLDESSSVYVTAANSYADTATGSVFSSALGPTVTCCSSSPCLRIAGKK